MVDTKKELVTITETELLREASKLIPTSRVGDIADKRPTYITVFSDSDAECFLKFCIPETIPEAKRIEIQEVMTIYFENMISFLTFGKYNNNSLLRAKRYVERSADNGNAVPE